MDGFPVSEPYSLWGGGTLGSGQALWLRGMAGLDVNGLTTVEVGLSRAMHQKFDLGAAVHATLGVSDALGGLVQGRVNILRRQSFRLGAELPLSIDVYPTSSEPVFVFGAEPALMMSTYLSPRVELFYGPSARLYLIEGVAIVGPQGRAGMTFYWGGAAFSLAGKSSYLFVSDLANRLAWSLELGWSLRWGSSP